MLNNIFHAKLFSPDTARKTEQKIYSKHIYINTFYFENFKTFKFTTFSKNQQFWKLFQKRFAGGICDLRGAPAMYSVAPYRHG